ncbi:hypothetical protein [Alteromonas sp. OM2203]|uniref:hypothetical protein n=1 Tax=Alteromonas sp. OM2203 TaxID=3398817 RepID=UPI003AF33443
MWGGFAIMPHMSAPVIGKLGVMMKILTFVVVMATFSSFNAHAVKVRSCENLEVKYIKLQLQNGNLIHENISDREFQRGTLGIDEVCELRSELVSDSLAFTLFRPKGESLSYILVHNGLDGSLKLYGPFIGNYT